MTGDINLRAPTNADMPFVRAVYFETQRWIIEELFGWRGEDVELAKFEESYDPANTAVIVVDGEDVGWMTVQRDEHIELDSLYLKPSMQGRGLGRSLVQGLISEAETTGKPLRLSTAKINPARRLYESLGFVNAGESEFKIFMEWRPNKTNVSAPTQEISIRAFQPDDAPRLCEIFYHSVHEVANAKYDKAQLDAWAPKIPDASKWLPILIEYATFLAIDEAEKPVAWISMTEAGYVDMLFCLPEAIGRGIAGRLYEKVEDLAKKRGLPRMTAHASLLAQPFFAKRGWRVEKHEMHVRNGVAIPRAEMSKDL